MKKEKTCSRCGGTGCDNDQWLRENGLQEPPCPKCNGKNAKPPKAALIRPMTASDLDPD